MKKNLFKILAVVIALAGIPAGLFLPRGVKTNGYNVISPNAIHWHIAIGIWLAFVLIGAFVWLLSILIDSQAPSAKVLSRVCIFEKIFLAMGFLAGLLISFRLGASSPWITQGQVAPAVVIPASFVWYWAVSSFVLFYVLSEILKNRREKFTKMKLIK